MLPIPQRRYLTIAAVMAILAAGVSAPVRAQAPTPAMDGRIYLSGDLGLGIGSDPQGSDGYTTELTPGMAINGAIGYAFGQFALETEIFYQGYLVDDQTKDGVSRAEDIPGYSGQEIEGNLSTTAIMANGYISFGPEDGTRAFIGAGIGMAWVKAEIRATRYYWFWSEESTDIVKDTDTVFAYQGLAGLVWPVTHHGDILLKYRYFATEDPSFVDYTGSAFEQDGQRTHSVSIGFRYTF